MTMSEYVKKILVFDEIFEGFAQQSKKVSGVMKVQKTNKVSLATIYITNFNRNLADKIECVLLVGKKFYVKKSDGCQFEIAIDNVGQYDDVACLVGAMQDGVTIPFAFATNNVGIRSEQLSDKLSNCQQVTKYEQFVCATDNYFEKEDEVIKDGFDLDLIRQKSNSKFKPIEMLADVKRDEEKSFFANARKMLVNIFENYPPCDELNDNIVDSFWVKVPFKKEKYFAFGLVQKNEKPQYIAYAVPGLMTKPPQDECFCFFATQNKEVGFWVICQDATSGLAVSGPKLGRKK